MPQPFQRVFRVRHYECDLYRHVNNADYLLYMQEAAFRDAGIAGEHVLAEQNDHHWWNTFISIEYILPLKDGDFFEVSTSCEHTSPGICRRSYDFRKGEQRELAARARSVAQPLSNHRTYSKDNPDGETEPRTNPFMNKPEEVEKSSVEQPAMPVSVYSLERKVRWDDLNAFGEVNPATLLSFLSDAAYRSVAAYHWPLERMLAAGFGILLRRNELEYREPARLDDTLIISTYLSNIKRVSALRHYRIARFSDGKMLARVNALGVWVNLDTGSPVRVPAQMLVDFAENISN
jgi:acyl-CoA thioester hydrolase